MPILQEAVTPFHRREELESLHMSFADSGSLCADASRDGVEGSGFSFVIDAPLAPAFLTHRYSFPLEGWRKNALENIGYKNMYKLRTPLLFPRPAVSAKSRHVHPLPPGDGGMSVENRNVRILDLPKTVVSKASAVEKLLPAGSVPGKVMDGKRLNVSNEKDGTRKLGLPLSKKSAFFLSPSKSRGCENLDSFEPSMVSPVLPPVSSYSVGLHTPESPHYVVDLEGDPLEQAELESFESLTIASANLKVLPSVPSSLLQSHSVERSSPKELADVSRRRRDKWDGKHRSALSNAAPFPLPTPPLFPSPTHSTQGGPLPSARSPLSRLEQSKFEVDDFQTLKENSNLSELVSLPGLEKRKHVSSHPHWHLIKRTSEFLDENSKEIMVIREFFESEGKVEDDEAEMSQVYEVRKIET
jgi:hypothetical protein